jgi:hypothetical protein
MQQEQPSALGDLACSLGSVVIVVILPLMAGAGAVYAFVKFIKWAWFY